MFKSMTRLLAAIGQVLRRSAEHAARRELPAAAADAPLAQSDPSTILPATETIEQVLPQQAVQAASQSANQIARQCPAAWNSAALRRNRPQRPASNSPKPTRGPQRFAKQKPQPKRQASVPAASRGANSNHIATQSVRMQAALMKARRRSDAERSLARLKAVAASTTHTATVHELFKAA